VVQVSCHLKARKSIKEAAPYALGAVVKVIADGLARGTLADAQGEFKYVTI
jgi:hypothetical protein